MISIRIIIYKKGFQCSILEEILLGTWEDQTLWSLFRDDQLTIISNSHESRVNDSEIYVPMHNISFELILSQVFSINFIAYKW